MKSLIKNFKLKIRNSRKGFLGITKKTLIMTLAVITVVTSSGLIYFFYFAPKAEAVWFDDDWQYREAVPIATHTAAENNVYITFQLDTATLITNKKLQSSCQDIRVTDIGGNLLSYHVGRTNACNNAATTIDALVPVMPAGSQTYYVYYGNPSAGSQDAGAFSQSVCGNSCTTNPTLNAEEKSLGPLAYWKFDDGTGTTAKDSTTNSNNGTLSGSTLPSWQTEDQCISGKCLYFDGSTSKVTGSKIVNNIQTLSFWIKPNTIATQGIFNLDGGTHKINTNSSGVISAAGFTSPTYYINGVSAATPTLTQNQWNFVEITTATGFNSTSSFTIGTDGTNFIKANIDEVKFYDYARSSAQVLADYNSRANAIGATAVLGTDTTDKNISNGLVGYWKMDEASWNGTAGEVKDSSGNGNNGTATGATDKPTTGAGKFGNGGVFDGTDDYVSVADNSTLDPTSNITVGAWVKFNSVSSAQSIVSKWDNTGNNNQYQLLLSGGNFLLSISSSGYGGNDGTTNVTGSTTATTGTWYHVVGTYINATKTASIYVNGALDGSQVLTNSGIYAGTSSLEIGVRQITDGSFDLKLNGTLDEIRVYNRALSPSEVSQLYNFAPGPWGIGNLMKDRGQRSMIHPAMPTPAPGMELLVLSGLQENMARQGISTGAMIM